MTEGNVLEIRNITVEYQGAGFGGIGRKRIRVLNDVSLSLSRGEVLTVLGESGSGKTTLARCIMGRVGMRSGEIAGLRGVIADARGVKVKASELHRHIQLVPQGTQNSLAPNLTVAELLGGVLRRRGLAQRELQRRMDELLNLSGLDRGILSRFPGQISGGQRQRLLIARALAMEPEIILFDEPVASLDVSIQARILNTLNRLRKLADLSIIFITHDLDIAEYISDRIAVIHDGGILECGSVDEVMNRPRNDYTRRLMAAGLGKSRWLSGIDSGKA